MHFSRVCRRSLFPRSYPLPPRRTISFSLQTFHTAFYLRPFLRGPLFTPRRRSGNKAGTPQKLVINIQLRHTGAEKHAGR